MGAVSLVVEVAEVLVHAGDLDLRLPLLSPLVPVQPDVARRPCLSPALTLPLPLLSYHNKTDAWRHKCRTPLPLSSPPLQVPLPVPVGILRVEVSITMLLQPVLLPKASIPYKIGLSRPHYPEWIAIGMHELRNPRCSRKVWVINKLNLHTSRYSRYSYTTK